MTSPTILNMKVYACEEAKFSLTPGELGSPSQRNILFLKIKIRIQADILSHGHQGPLCPGPHALCPPHNCLLLSPCLRAFALLSLLPFPCLAASCPSDLGAEVSSTAWFTSGQLGASFSCCRLSFSVTSGFSLLLCSPGPRGSWEELCLVVTVLISSSRMETL